MRLISFLFVAGLAFAEDQSRVQIIITLADGTTHTEQIVGAPASAGLDTLTQWAAAQRVCTAGEDGEQVCTPRFANPAAALRALVVQQAIALARQYPSAALAQDLAELAAKAALVEAKRKALAEEALGQ